VPGRRRRDQGGLEPNGSHGPRLEGLATGWRVDWPGKLNGMPRDAVGDKLVLLFGDDQRRVSLRLTESNHDINKDLLSSASALEKAIKGAEEGDEIEFDQDDGQRRKVLIESVD
jgi:hypothetical protein